MCIRLYYRIFLVSLAFLKLFFPWVYTVIVRNLANGYHVHANKVSIFILKKTAGL